jgi:hypothetical protein
VKLNGGDAFIVDRSNVRLDREPQTWTEEVNGKVLAYVIEDNLARVVVGFALPLGVRVEGNEAAAPKLAAMAMVVPPPSWTR